MKFLWQVWLAMALIGTAVAPVTAQHGSQYGPEIGSYQSILSRAGYGDAGYTGVPVAQASPNMYGQPVANHGPANYANGYGAANYAGAACSQPGGCAGPVFNGAPVTHGQYGNYATPATYPANPPAAAPVNQIPAQPVQPTPPPAASYEAAPQAMMAAPAQGCVGTPAYGTPTYAAPAYGQVYGNQAGGYVDGGYVSSGYIEQGCNYDAPVYSAGKSLGRIFSSGGSGANTVLSSQGLVFFRDYEDERRIAVNPAGDELFSNDADHDSIGGLDVGLTRRKCNGNGWQVRYFGLFPDEADATLTGANVYAVGLRGFDRITHVPSGLLVSTVYDNGTSQTIRRNSEIHNIELNLLRNGGCYTTRRGRCANFEVLGGFRWFNFDEGFSYSTTNPGLPTYPDLTYNLDIENTLLGLQLGASNEICLTNRLRLANATRVGIFNNHARMRQFIVDENGVYAQVNARDYDYSDRKNDVAMLGELDLGVIFQLSCKSRLRAGYRAIGVSGVGLAVDQIPYQFDDPYDVQRADTNGSLLLHGAYFGSEFCF